MEHEMRPTDEGDMPMNEEIDVDTLENLLKVTVKTRIESGQHLDSVLRKDIRIYDFLKYGIDYLKDSTPPQSPSSAPSLAEEPGGSAGVLRTKNPDHAPVRNPLS